MLAFIPPPQTREEKIDAWLAQDSTVARCEETGAKLIISRKQWTLIYEEKAHCLHETRHWQRAKVSSAEILEKAQASLDKIVLERTIRDAIWTHQIDQVSTREVAEQYGISVGVARTILMKIRNGISGDARFKPDLERGGVVIEDGHTFDYSPMDMDGGGISNGTPKHYIWFCS